ncbi:gluconeogenesis factor YvcK family protein [Clostridium grantii]|uniref:Putative gluconeogenesis factor n=1 Tax=Clostridium grantii DSM 8605 TaxID=1121316 RepID=A0A1M5U5G1_9CLOT|nr:YvcK family protein [Clostridium grantii]SHH58325.1 conserved hypothetical protein, cofD-related [Clostridium grantii DSM 8605]
MIFYKKVKGDYKIKRWILTCIIGLIFTIMSCGTLVYKEFLSLKEIYINILLAIGGLIIIYYSIYKIIRRNLDILTKGSCKLSVNPKSHYNIKHERKNLMKGPKIVAIGGGTGLSTMLRGLKAYTSNITAIVTVGDDGGGSGTLREDLGMLPPGDIRNCILALAETEPIMQDLLQYRFKEGRLKNQNFGNLFLAAMDGISGGFEEAVQKMSDVLAVKGKVLPVTLDNMVLKATLKNGRIIEGESIIPEQCLKEESSIDTIEIIPSHSKALNEAIIALKEADAIVIGPGSLYTSIIPNLLVQGITEEIIKSKAIKIYVCNVMTQPGETDGYLLEHHLDALFKHSSNKLVDYVIANDSYISKQLKEKYLDKKSIPVYHRDNTEEKYKVKIIYDDIVSIKNDYIRHNSDKLAGIIFKLISKNKKSK